MGGKTREPATVREPAPRAVPSPDELRRISEFKTRFLNMAAHELNTPITPMRLQLHLVNSGAYGPVPESQAKALGVVQRNLDRLAGLVRDILDVARMEAQRLKFHVTDFPLDGAIREAWEAYEEPARRVGIRLLAPAMSQAVVRADRDRTIQILYNLMSNAVKFTPADGEIRMEVRRGPAQVEVLLHDTGIGMDPDQLARLFHPFVRLHDEAPAGGTGLGLYISRGLAEEMGGSLIAESPGPGKGSTFRLCLPLASSPHAFVEPKLRPPDDEIALRLRELI